MIDSANLRDLLHSEDPERRKHAIRSIVRSNDPRVLTWLSAAYRAETDPEIRDLVVKAGRYIQRLQVQQPAPIMEPDPPIAEHETVVSTLIAARVQVDFDTEIDTQAAATEVLFSTPINMAIVDLPIEPVAQSRPDFEFIKILTCAGIPSKAVLTGVMMLAMPLMLGPTLKLALVLLIYAAGVFIALRLLDRIALTSSMLFGTTLTSGLSLIAIGFSGWKTISENAQTPLSALLLICGTLLLGITHGLLWQSLHAHFSDRLYSRLENTGLVIGPVVMGILFVLFGSSVFTVSWVGILVVSLAFLLLMRA